MKIKFRTLPLKTCKALKLSSNYYFYIKSKKTLGIWKRLALQSNLCTCVIVMPSHVISDTGPSRFWFTLKAGSERGDEATVIVYEMHNSYLIILVRCWVAPGLGVRGRRREKWLMIITRDSAMGRGCGIVRGVGGARGKRKGTPSRWRGTCIIIVWTQSFWWSMPASTIKFYSVGHVEN